MNIQEIKARLGVTSLDISSQTDAAGVVDPNWVSNWNDTSRVRVTMHKEVFDKIVAEPTFSGLALKGPETVTPKEAGKESYTRYVIITPKSILASL